MEMKELENLREMNFFLIHVSTLHIIQGQGYPILPPLNLSPPGPYKLDGRNPYSSQTSPVPTSDRLYSTSYTTV